MDDGARFEIKVVILWGKFTSITLVKKMNFARHFVEMRLITCMQGWRCSGTVLGLAGRCNPEECETNRGGSCR